MKVYIFISPDREKLKRRVTKGKKIKQKKKREEEWIESGEKRIFEINIDYLSSTDPVRGSSEENIEPSIYIRIPFRRV